jgi:hypothetical protein
VPVAPRVRERETKNGSTFARALGRHLSSAHGFTADIHWGNDGFCVDVALDDGSRGALGVLCDVSRYERARSAVEWDVFRSEVLMNQGWKLARVWTPEFFRDPERVTGTILANVPAGTPRAKGS